MPEALQEWTSSCPWCGEPITLLIDGSVAQQHYVEDCFVCCRPIEVVVSFASDGSPEVALSVD